MEMLGSNVSYSDCTLEQNDNLLYTIQTYDTNMCNTNFSKKVAAGSFELYKVFDYNDYILQYSIVIGIQCEFTYLHFFLQQTSQ